MALASSMNSTLMGSPLTRVFQNGLFVPVNYRLRTSRISTTSVKCMSEVPEQEEKKDLGPLSPPPKPKMSTKFSDVLAFSGPAPERINGRLAMIGFVSAMAVELAKGQNLLSQVSDGGATWFVGSAVVLSLASLIPLFKGVSVESKSDGFMTSDAELWNGRFAMLGLVALAFTEYVKGGTLI